MNSFVITMENKNVVLNWLRNQINKNADIFIDSGAAKADLDKFFVLKRKGGKKDIYLTNDDISVAKTEEFINKFLNPAASKKLGITLRVSSSRLGVSVLQVKIEYANKRKLDYLVKESGLTKVEVVNKLIDLATIWNESDGSNELSVKTWTN